MVRISHIDKEALEFILAASRASHPKEFAGVLKANKETISEILLLPGTISSGGSAVLRFQMLGIYPAARGTVHSHPNPNASPSREDLALFDKFGEVHIIAAFPYTANSWRAYNQRGEPIELEVVG